MSSDKRGTLIVIVGATGSGKTDLSIELAEHFSAPVISTDSRQVFRGMPIGTAQPSAEQLSRAKHYFIADRDITAEYNAGIFEKEALALLAELFAVHDYVIAVGGSGLYIDALCRGFDEFPETDRALRTSLEDIVRHNGLAPLLAELRELDPDYYAQVDRDNPARVIRAVEVCRQTGKPYSGQRKGYVAERPFRIIKIGIDMPRAELYARIDRRVELMMQAGLESEARSLYPNKQLNALQTVGYKELFDYFDGEYTLDRAVELIQRNSLRYAKRQLTWFRRDPEIEWFAREDKKKMIFFIEKFGG